MFIDVCFMPEVEARQALDAKGIPFMFGNVSHEPWQNYDVIVMSHAIMPEVLNFPFMFEHSGVPLTMELREKEQCPIFLYGGAAGSGGFSILGGSIKDQGKGLYDIGLLGAGEPTLPVITKELLEFNITKGIKNSRKELIEHLMATSEIKDYLMIPNKYGFTFGEDKVEIKAVKYFDERTPKKVKMGRMNEPNFYGFNKKMFNVSGENAHSGDIQISSGCSSLLLFLLFRGTRSRALDREKLGADRA